MNLKNRIVAVVASAAIIVPAIAIAAHQDKGGTKVASFTSQLRPDTGVVCEKVGKAGAGSKIEGEVKDKNISLKEEGDKLVVRVNLQSLDTHLGMRNDHLKKKLLDNKLYGAELVVSKADVKAKKNNGTVEGSLRLGFVPGAKDGGVTKKVPVTIKTVEEGGNLKVVGTLAFNYRDFYKWDGKQEAACNMCVCVADTINVSVTLNASKDE